MTEALRSPRVYRFGVFELDPASGELRKQGMKIKLQGQPIDILAMLLDRPGEVISREEIQKKLWPNGTNVEFEHSLNAAVKRLRDALDDSAETPRYIETLARRGYRFVAPTEALAPSPAKSKTVRWIALGSVAALALLVVLVGLNVGGSRDRIFGRATKPLRSVAVIPLANLSGDPQQDYFADGMTEALITELGKISALRVISRQSMMQYKGTKKSAPQIAKELNVEAVVEGSVLRAGDRVRISVQLIEAVPERHLWASSYDRNLRDVLALHNEMARAVADEVRAKLTPQEKALLASARPVNPEAYAAYLRGRYFWDKWPEGVEKALESFQEAIKKDPFYAPAHAGAAQCYSVRGFFFQPPKEAFPKARAAALKAMELDDNLAEAHSALGFVKFSFDWDWSGAEREFKRAIELNPNSVLAHRTYAIYLTAMGRSEEAIAEAKQAQHLDPFSLPVGRALGWNYMNARRYDEAIAQYKNVLQLDSNYVLARVQLVQSYVLNRMYSEAFTEYRTHKQEIIEQGHEGRVTVAFLHAASGRKKEALKLVHELTRLSAQEYVDPFYLAVAYAKLDRDRAFEWLENAYDGHTAQMPQMNAELLFDPLRSDARFQDLLRRMNFPP